MALPPDGWVPATQAGIVDAALPEEYQAHYVDEGATATPGGAFVTQSIEGSFASIGGSENLVVTLHQSNVFVATLVDMLTATPKEGGGGGGTLCVPIESEVGASAFAVGARPDCNTPTDNLNGTPYIRATRPPC